MSSILEMLGQQLGGDTLRQISQTLGTDERQTETAVSAALPTLLGALSRNAATEQGAASLNAALDKDHDGSVLGNLAGLLGGGGQSASGAGILKHVLGSRQPRVEAGISQASGLDAGSTGKLLTMLAPLVMGQLGQAKRQNNLDTNGLASMLSQEGQAAESAGGGLLGSLLDADGDGDFDMADVAKKGAGMLGKLLGGK